MDSRRFQKLPPVRLIRILNAFRTFLLKLNRRLFPGNVILYEHVQYLWLLPSLYVAARLDIATLLKSKALTAEEMAVKLNVDKTNLLRLMRALSSQGIFKQSAGGRFGLNAVSMGLTDEPGSLRYMILQHLGPVNWNLMGTLEYSVRTGHDAFTEKYGKPVYDFLKDHPDQYDLFDKSMSNLSELSLAPVLNAYDFSQHRVITDLGGGEGFLLANILKHHPASQGILFDTPGALVKADEMMTRQQVTDRVKIIQGDFFSHIPEESDLFLLKNVIHNWSDEESVALLTKICQSLGPGKRLLIIEMVVPDCSGPSMAKLLDIQMMATMAGGKERTAGEFRALLEKSGLTLTRIIPTIAPLSLIEAEKTG